LDGAEACSGGLVFASEILVSTDTIAVTMYVVIQQSMNHQQGFDEYGG